MFIAHPAAGYLLTSFLIAKRKSSFNYARNKVMIAGIIASVFPDIDLVYFYIVDHQKFLHHGYWTHIPLFWFTIFCLWFLIAIALRKNNFLEIELIVSSNVMLHLLLDTIVGKIRWLSPFSHRDIFFVEVPSRYDLWVLNFVVHWTFLLEIAIVLCGICLFLSNLRKKMTVSSVAPSPSQSS